MKMTIDLENAEPEFRTYLQEMAERWGLTPERLLLAAAQTELLNVMEDDNEECADLLIIRAHQMEALAQARKAEAAERELKKHHRGLRIVRHRHAA